MGNKIEFIELNFFWGVVVFWVRFLYYFKSLFRLFEAVSAITFLDGFWPPTEPSQPAWMDKSIHFLFCFETFPYYLVHVIIIILSIHGFHKFADLNFYICFVNFFHVHLFNIELQYISKIYDWIFAYFGGWINLSTEH